MHLENILAAEMNAALSAKLSWLFQGESQLPAAGVKEHLFTRRVWVKCLLYCSGNFLLIFPMCFCEIPANYEEQAPRSPPSPEHWALEKNVKEETQSLHWLIFLAVFNQVGFLASCFFKIYEYHLQQKS